MRGERKTINPDAEIIMYGQELNEQTYAIGLLSEAPQPVVISKRLRNVPEKAIWAFEPGSHFGIHRIDEFFFDDPHQQVSQ